MLLKKDRKKRSLRRKYWNIYISKRDKCNDQLDFSKNDFLAVPAYHAGWAADPFLIEKNGKLYIFAELYSYSDWYGSIGYCVYSNGLFSKWKVVIRNGTHFSFPNIYEAEDGIYIMPENCAAGKIPVYKAIDFPDVWEEQKPIFIGSCMCDTIHLSRELLLSYSVEKSGYALKLLKEGIVLNSKSDLNQHLRPGGKAFTFRGKLYRPAQCCENSYGEGLYINAVLVNGEEMPAENTVLEIRPESVKLDQEFGKRIGLHTYNRSANYEVIDILFERFSLMYLLIRVKEKFRKKLNSTFPTS